MKELAPLLQTLAWISLILYSVYKFSSQLKNLFEAIEQRIKSGSSFKAGPVELGQDLKSLDKVQPIQSPITQTEDDWSKEREEVYRNNSGLFLAHIIEPSKKRGQVFDVFIYLVRHKSELFSDIDYAEFFLGSHWGNRVFKKTGKSGLIGISTSAYGPFLCTCKVKMRDGKEIRLNRYIDFEMSRVFEAN